jgi:CspA family cold shock protein
MYGTIKRVIRDRGFGFIRSQDGEEVFFHRTSVERKLDFDSLREGQRVEFDLQRGDKGPRAVSVRTGPGELTAAQA